MITDFFKFINEQYTTYNNYKIIWDEDFKSYNLYDNNENKIGFLQISHPYKDRKLDVSLQNKNCINIFNFYIEEKYRNKGFGKLLLKKVIEELKNKADILTLQVFKDNISALKLYENLGFKPFYNTSYGVIHMYLEFF